MIGLNIIHKIKHSTIVIYLKLNEVEVSAIFENLIREIYNDKLIKIISARI